VAIGGETLLLGWLVATEGLSELASSCSGYWESCLSRFIGDQLALGAVCC